NLRYGVIERNLNTGKTPTHNHTFSMMGGIGPARSYAGNLSYRSQGQWQPALFSRSWGSSLGVTHVRGSLTVSASPSLTGGRNGTSGSSGNVLGRVMVERGEWTTGSLSGHVSNKISTSQSQVN